MSISDLGSLGEFVASIAVLVTLVLLLIQFRAARRELSGQVTREVKRHNNNTFHQLTQDPTLMALHVRGQKEFESLNEEEKLRWLIWMYTWISQTEDGYLAKRSGIPDMSWVDSYIVGVASTLRSPGGVIIWPKLRGWFDEEFVRVIDDKIAEDSATWLQMLLD